MWFKFWIKHKINKLIIRFDKELHNEYWSTIRIESKKLESKISDATYKDYSERSKYINNANRKCPNCSSKNVVDKYERIKGKGSIDISGDFIFGIGSVHGSGKSKLDTHTVNECGDCGNQWEKNSASWRSTSYELKRYIFRVEWFMDSYNDLKSIKYNPTDLSERYNSLEEKRNAKETYMEDYINNIRLYSNGISIDTILALYKVQQEDTIWFNIRKVTRFYKGVHKDDLLQRTGLYDLQDKLIAKKKSRSN